MPFLSGTAEKFCTYNKVDKSKDIYGKGKHRTEGYHRFNKNGNFSTCIFKKRKKNSVSKTDQNIKKSYCIKNGWCYHKHLISYTEYPENGKIITTECGKRKKNKKCSKQGALHKCKVFHINWQAVITRFETGISHRTVKPILFHTWSKNKDDVPLTRWMARHIIITISIVLNESTVAFLSHILGNKKETIRRTDIKHPINPGFMLYFFCSIIIVSSKNFN